MSLLMDALKTAEAAKDQKGKAAKTTAETDSVSMPGASAVSRPVDTAAGTADSARSADMTGPAIPPPGLPSTEGDTKTKGMPKADMPSSDNASERTSKQQDWQDSKASGEWSRGIGSGADPFFSSDKWGGEIARRERRGRKMGNGLIISSLLSALVGGGGFVLYQSLNEWGAPSVSRGALVAQARPAKPVPVVPIPSPSKKAVPTIPQLNDTPNTGGQGLSNELAIPHLGEDDHYSQTMSAESGPTIPGLGLSDKEGTEVDDASSRLNLPKFSDSPIQVPVSSPDQRVVEPKSDKLPDGPKIVELANPALVKSSTPPSVSIEQASKPEAKKPAPVKNASLVKHKPVVAAVPDKQVSVPVSTEVAQPSAKPIPVARKPIARRPTATQQSVKDSTIEAERYEEPAEKSVRISHRRVEELVLQQLNQGKEALNQGDYSRAIQSYGRVLEHDRSHRDALIGMASVALRQKRFDDARKLYERVLRVTPSDSVAMAGLISLGRNVDPVHRESRLKIMLKREPNSAHLHFVLGTLYITHRRWALAQDSFDKALKLDPQNPDIAYNLAVSLDQMRKPREALAYYRNALKLGQNRAINFDLEAARKRAKALSRRFSAQ
ncbi:MAG: tetratricopeptide repeat protein [Magnetococcales bacterium]|nr:tetratricopeptide repeat protein [Magnetococcales bacterium]